MLEEINIEGATGILINVSAGENLTLKELHEACAVVQDAAHEDAHVIFGAVIDDNMDDEVRVTIIATGFPFIDDKKIVAEPPLRKLQPEQLSPEPTPLPEATKPVPAPPPPTAPASENRPAAYAYPPATEPVATGIANDLSNQIDSAINLTGRDDLDVPTFMRSGPKELPNN